MTQRVVGWVLSVTMIGVLAAGIAAVAAAQNEHELGAAVTAIETGDLVPVPRATPDPGADEPAATETSPAADIAAPLDSVRIPAAATVDTQPAPPPPPAASVSSSASSGVGLTTNRVRVPAPISTPVATTVPSAPPVTSTPPISAAPSDDVAAVATGGSGEDIACDGVAVYFEGCESADTEADIAADVEPTPATCLPDTDTGLPASNCVTDDGTGTVVDPPPTTSNVTCAPVNGDGTGPVGCTSSDSGVVPIEHVPGYVPTEEHP